MPEPGDHPTFPAWRRSVRGRRHLENELQWDRLTDAKLNLARGLDAQRDCLCGSAAGDSERTEKVYRRLHLDGLDTLRAPQVPRTSLKISVRRFPKILMAAIRVP